MAFFPAKFSSAYLLRTGMLCLCLLITCTSSHAVAEELSKLDKLKAAYLFNFSKYISWPENAFQSVSAPIRMCIQASDSFVTFSRALTAGRKIGKQQRTVEVVTNINDETCHLRYLSGNEHSVLPFSENTLIVASDQNVKAPNASIRFYREGAKLRFEVDLEEVERLKLTLSSELLKLAKIK